MFACARAAAAASYNEPVRLNPKTFAWLLRRSVIAAFDDGCIGQAKGAAYSALLSFFPVLASSAAILVQSHADFVSRTLQNALSQIVPPGSQDLVVQQFRATGAHPLSLIVVAALVSLWAASGVIKSLIEGFHAAYRVPRNRGIVHQSWVAMGLVLVVAIPLLAASVLIVFGSQLERAVLKWIEVDPLLNPFSWLWGWLSRLVRYALAFAATVSVTALLYYFGPYRPQRWRFVWPGAIVATVLWLAATTGFAWYTRNIAHYNVMYGSIGAGIALLVWMYVLAFVALVGCEFNAQYERGVGV
jgi:membrane protein